MGYFSLLFTTQWATQSMTTSRALAPLGWLKGKKSALVHHVVTANPSATLHQ